MNSLLKTVTQQHCDCDLNPGPSAPESSTLTTQLPSHPHYYYHHYYYDNTTRYLSIVLNYTAGMKSYHESSVDSTAAEVWSVLRQVNASQPLHHAMICPQLSFIRTIVQHALHQNSHRFNASTNVFTSVTSHGFMSHSTQNSIIF